MSHLEVRPAAAQEATVPLPDTHYLNTHYWWAYVHPRAVWLFERPWLVNLILFGNYRRLCSAVLRRFGKPVGGHTLQVACAYGSLTPRLARQLGPAATLEVIDILPIQLANLRDKLPADSRVQLRCMDSSALSHAGASFDRVLLFFLLHEQPAEVRRRTLAEALRVLKPGGMLAIVDYAQPRWWNPLRYLWRPVLARLEPFALELWRAPVPSWMPAGAPVARLREQRFFGGLYQMLVITRGP
jgi:ubiquinone/menaquinone biosynthesis C-methylase UbiE